MVEEGVEVIIQEDERGIPQIQVRGKVERAAEDIARIYKAVKKELQKKEETK